MADNKRDLRKKFDELIDRVKFKYDDGTVKILNGIKNILRRCDIGEANYDVINDAIDDIAYELSKTSQRHVFPSLQNFFDFISLFDSVTERPLKRICDKDNQPCSSKRLRSANESESDENDDANEEDPGENKVKAGKQNGGLDSGDSDRPNATATLLDAHENGDNHRDADEPCTSINLLDSNENRDYHDDDVDKPCTSSSLRDINQNDDDDDDDPDFRLCLSEDENEENEEVENDDSSQVMNTQERTEYIKNLSENDKGHLRCIEKLHDTLSMLHTKINEFEKSELTLDDLADENSNYIIESRLKERYMQIWNKLNNLSKMHPHLIDFEVKKSLLTPYWRKIKYEGSREPEINESICKFLHENRAFPDYTEMFEVVCEANTRASLNKSDAELEKIAEVAFKTIGHEIQKHRMDDDRLILLSRIVKEEELDLDPAVNNKELLEKLEDNRKKGEKKLEDIINKYAEDQADIKVELFSESSEEDSESSVYGLSNETLNDDE